ncbi:SCO6745 family protein [Actinoplanes sp. NPDC049316]|uniref:SCO6745 family protein n=1 Tax=Actinoplanes sp. NPDC049316 TaxID=3154727 RepID=UPI00341D73F8
MTSLDPAVAREAWRLAEPLHAMVYFVPEATERYEALGISASAGYFASRGGVFGAVGPGPVVATFYNFHPDRVARYLPAVWATTTPAAAIEARLAAADAALHRGLGDALSSDGVAEAATLARRAAESAIFHQAGRPLYAAHAGLEWPKEPHLVLWHAQMLLREFRGDGHVAALLLGGVTGLQSMILHAASGQADGGFLRASRGWSREEWAAETESLRSQGLMAGDDLTGKGRDLRAHLEAETDRLAAPAYEILGTDGCARLAELARPLSRTLVKAGFLGGAAPARPR